MELLGDEEDPPLEPKEGEPKNGLRENLDVCEEVLVER